jgi:phage terminase Nu1 subunit (DNA packaging protein)
MTAPDMTKPAPSREARAVAPKEKTTQVAFRLADTLLGRLDRYAKQLDREHPGLVHSRVDALRVLLTRALDEAEENETKKPRRT